MLWNWDTVNVSQAVFGVEGKNKSKLLMGGVAPRKMGLRVSNILAATRTESREHITLRVLSLDILSMNAGLHLGTTLLL